MDSFRWFRVRRRGDSLPVEEFRRLLLGSQGVDCWFSVAEDSDYRFCKRMQLLVPVLTSEGEEKIRTVDSVSVIRFAVLKGNPDTVLRVFNPGRNLQALMGGIERAVGQGFSSRALVFEGAEPVSILQRADIRRVVGVKLKNVVIDNDCVGRMELVSKEGVDLESVGMLKNVRYTIANVKYEVVVDGVRGAFSVSENGLVKVGGKLAPLIVSEIERDLIFLSTVAS